MKLFILLLLLTSCAKQPAVEVESAVVPSILGDSKDAGHMSPEVIIAEIEKGNFTVLDPFFDTNELFPASFVRDGYVIDFSTIDTLDYTKPIPNIDFSNPLTNTITFSNIGEPITYTNKYGVPFIEDRKLLISLSILTNMRQYQCTGFEWLITSIANAQTTDEAFNADFQFGDSSYGVYIDYIIGASIKRYFDRDSNLSKVLDKSELKSYFRHKILSTSLENIQFSMINYQIHQLVQKYQGTEELYPASAIDNQSCYP
ncbi:MAG: hypothetical protein ACRCY4_07705 [Brevinema sp.]